MRIEFSKQDLTPTPCTKATSICITLSVHEGLQFLANYLKLYTDFPQRNISARINRTGYFGNRLYREVVCLLSKAYIKLEKQPGFHFSPTSKSITDVFQGMFVGY